ncbi:methyltransferase domain-containing protein [Streptomyces sp. 4N509B]|uniref:methyltransferase domain-containing protein n=1 Tax=Streptomyces sp. 4N509B TaxID=3457413 RepID=UPI003FD620BD
MTLQEGAEHREGPVPDEATPAWEAAFREVPRSRFLPDLIWPFDAATGTATEAVHRAADPAAWGEAAASDAPIVTQWDDGHHEGDAPGELATSSASAPSLVAGMLADLDVEPGMRVLEVGTGTGWNAALLAHRLGEENVVTVEVDPDVAEQARANLANLANPKRVRAAPRVVTGDGFEGWPDGAPYDRVIVTCGMRRIPAAWIEQTRPGGVILVPWGTRYVAHDALARLTVRSDGTASGRLLRLLEFMKLRAQRSTSRPTFPHDLPLNDTTVPTPPPPHDRWHPFTFVAGLFLRDAVHAVQRHDDGHTLWLYSLAGDAWTAAVRRSSLGGDTVVRRAGDRRLWDEVEAAWRWWRANGEPGIERFGLTVTPEGERVWLDEPGRPVPC